VISLESVRKSWQAATANLAKRALSDSKQTWAVSDTDQLFKAYEYQPLTVAGHQGAPVRLRDIAEVVDSVEDTRNLGLSNGKHGVLMAIFRQPGANMIETVDRIIDRKSTRLNSSHEWISYAVFCLKNKT